MLVLLAPSVPGCSRIQILAAAQQMGQEAGVEVTEGDWAEDVELLPDGTVRFPDRAVLVMTSGDLRPGVLAVTTPLGASGGWIRGAAIRFNDEFKCTELWLTVALHEFGHVYGLSDTRNVPEALMHWQAKADGEAGTYLRPWERAHLRRRTPAL